MRPFGNIGITGNCIQVRLHNRQGTFLFAFCVEILTTGGSIETTVARRVLGRNELLTHCDSYQSSIFSAREGRLECEYLLNIQLL